MLPLDEFLSQVDEATTMGPLLDPSQCDVGWLTSAAEWEKLARATKRYLKDIEDIKLGGDGSTESPFKLLEMIEDAAKFDEDDSREVLECKLEQIQNYSNLAITMLGGRMPTVECAKCKQQVDIGDISPIPIKGFEEKNVCVTCAGG